jgi:tripartite-type tricarboxylate transporter receptor subunit TctC
LKLAMSAAAVAALTRAASAEVYPSRPVRLITPFGSAGAPDIITRMLAQWLTERLGQSFVVEIRAGGAAITFPQVSGYQYSRKPRAAAS